MNIAIVGATGNVGRKIIEILEKKKINIKNLFLLASKNSEGKKINYNGKELTVNNLEKFNFASVNIAFFAAGSGVAEKWAHMAAEKTIVIDNSKYFRMDKHVPLVVAEVNPESLNTHNNIIANPNCSTIQLMLPLKPLHDKYKIK